MSLCCCRRFLLLCVWLGVLIESFCLIDEREKCVRAQQIVFNFLKLIGLKVRMPWRRWNIRTFDPDSHWLRKEGASASRVST